MVNSCDPKATVTCAPPSFPESSFWAARTRIRKSEARANQKTNTPTRPEDRPIDFKGSD